MSESLPAPVFNNAFAHRTAAPLVEMVAEYLAERLTQYLRLIN